MTTTTVSPSLEARDLYVGYHTGDTVVNGINLRVAPGEMVALLGPNGAGKTTTMHALSGVLPAAKGEVRVNGEVTTTPLHQRARNGLAYVTEERSVFMGLTTAENLRVGGADRDRALAIFPELEKRLDVRAGLLSGGEQQMLTLARALVRQPRILLADELSLGLAAKVVTRLLDTVRTVADQQGMAILLVEQHVRKVLQYVDRAYVMRRGQIVLEGDASDLRNRIDEVERAYLHSDEAASETAVGAGM